MKNIVKKESKRDSRIWNHIALSVIISGTLAASVCDVWARPRKVLTTSPLITSSTGTGTPALAGSRVMIAPVPYQTEDACKNELLRTVLGFILKAGMALQPEYMVLIVASEQMNEAIMTAAGNGSSNCSLLLVINNIILGFIMPLTSSGGNNNVETISVSTEGSNNENIQNQNKVKYAMPLALRLGFLVDFMKAVLAAGTGGTVVVTGVEEIETKKSVLNSLSLF